ncbi:hypothetical protein ACFSCV_15325 [Methylopila henanensis]|uniref:Uncharacterized protein n=1 Tax=Methylopila henanensis TaxID=873516 RepID=A0ABW4KBF3_9HYPH
MSGRLSFRVSTAMIVGAYAIIAGVLVLALGGNLLQAASTYTPQMSWLMPEATGARIAALKAAGRADVASLYALVAALSWGLIGALAAGGFAWGALNKGETVIGVDKAFTYVAVLSGLYALSTGMTMAVHALHVTLPPGGLSAVPALWFATMIPSAAILARIGGMVMHDLGALIAIAIDAEPKRLSELVATVEARRGAESLEARVARLIARRAPRA